MQMEVIDSHVHCGKTAWYSYDEYFASSGRTNISGAVIFAPVPEIYDRVKRDFQDNLDWQDKRKRANEYVLTLGNKELQVFPFFFVWNDFITNSLDSYLGIKWHRHISEPKYEYDSEKCKKFIEEVRKRDIPIILEEEFENTLFFINELAKDVKIIIPHLGALNGGYEKFKKENIWQMKNIYADTALADMEEINDYIKNYGSSRLMFGSDFPFSEPRDELGKIFALKLNENDLEKITRKNLLNLIKSI